MFSVINKKININFDIFWGEYDGRRCSIDDFLNESSLVSDVAEHEDNTNKVSLMTVHSVKGLEYEYVFLVGIEEGVFPHFNSLIEGTNDAIEEEGRLMYVAITRAKKKLWIMNAKKRLLFGQIQCNVPSRFIDEIDDKCLDMDKKTINIIDKVNKFRKESMFTNRNVEYNKGDRVIHDEYGEGIITNVDKKILTIAFPHPFGVRKFIKGHKNIVKV